MPAYYNPNNNTLPSNIHPIDELKTLAASWDINDIFTEEFSIQIDKKNVFPCFRDLFYIPMLKDLPEGKHFLRKINF